MCTPVSTVPYLFALRSAAHGDLVVPRKRLQLGNRAFCVAGPVAWNSLPLSFGTYIINVQSDAQYTSVFSILLQWLTVFQSTSSEHCTAPYSDSSHVTAPYKLSFYYYYYYYLLLLVSWNLQQSLTTRKYETPIIANRNAQTNYCVSHCFVFCVVQPTFFLLPSVPAEFRRIEVNI